MKVDKNKIEEFIFQQLEDFDIEKKHHEALRRRINQIQIFVDTAYRGALIESQKTPPDTIDGYPILSRKRNRSGNIIKMTVQEGKVRKEYIFDETRYKDALNKKKNG